MITLSIGQIILGVLFVGLAGAAVGFYAGSVFAGNS